MTKVNFKRREFLAGATALTAATGFAGSALAQVSFDGQDLEFVNFGGPGSPPDVWLRTLVPFLERHLAGNPTISTTNKPGAGSMISANYTARAIPNDGTAFGSMNAIALGKAAQGNPSAQFDLNEMEIIGAQKLTRVVVIKKEGLSSFDDLLAMDGELIVGMESDATPYFDSLFALTGINGRIISSYQRFPDTLQAFRSGEVDAMPMSVIEWLTFGPDLSNEGAFAAIQYGFAEGGVISATQAVDIPTGHDLVQQLNASAVGTEDWNEMTAQAAGQSVSNQIWAPAGTPVDIVEALSQAFVDATSDPEFQALHIEQYGLPVEWNDRASSRAIVDDIIEIYAD